MRLIVLALLLATPALAQTNDGARPGNIIGTGQSLPRSDKASNIDSQNTQSELAPNLPAPPASGDNLQSLLLSARAALKAGRTGEAQEALERAETRALDRVIPAGTEHIPVERGLPARISNALHALGAGRNGQAIAIINAALPMAARADIP
jgi:hypothetical protein